MGLFKMLKKKPSTDGATSSSSVQEEYDSAAPWYGWDIRMKSSNQASESQPKRVFGGSLLTTSQRTHNLQRCDNVSNTNQEEGTNTLRRISGTKSVSDGHLIGVNIQKIRLLGVGSSGRVYLVRSQSNLDSLTTVQEDSDEESYEAMKVVSKATSSSEVMAMEGEMMGALDHPLIVKRLRSFEDEHNRYICMPFVGGGELFHHLHKSGKFPEKVAKFFAAEILTALEYVHSKGICYRDLKPENILLSHTGHIQLIDFGTARFKDADNKNVTVAGTVEYLAPEAVKMQKNDFCSDWWALGILLYEMLFGVTPFYSPMNSEMCELIVKSKLQFPPTPEISPEAKLILKGLLCKDPSKRLGCSKKSNGAAEIKQHPFFSEFQSMWENLTLVVPPIIPKLAHSADTSYFENSTSCE